MSSLKGKRLLLQGASRGNLGLIKTAKQHGVYVVMTGMGGDFPCNPYADKFCYADISDPDAVLKVAQDEEVDGAIICCSDTGLRAVGRCNDVLGLTGITEKAAMESSNKLLMKQKLINAGVRTARYNKVSSLDSLKNVISELGYPVIIKATDLQGSRGINIVYDESNLRVSFEDTMRLTKEDYCIVEEYLVGREFGAQSFVYKGNILFVLPHGDKTVMCRTAVPIGHYMPYIVSDGLYSDTCLQVTKSIYAIGLDNCAVNVDLIEKDGKAYIIELTGRVGANCLPELTSNYFGINYYDMILATALGESPLTIFEQRRPPMSTVSRMIKSEKSGICKRVQIPEIENCTIHLFIHVGSEVRAFTNSNDAIGEVIVSGETLEECEQLISRVLSSIIIELL